MAKFSIEAKVGVFVIIGIVILSYMSMKIGKIPFKRDAGYELQVRFVSASGLKEDVPVEIAGVEVGRIRHISLVDDKAQVTLWIRPDVKLTRDVTAAIRTKGILGDKYVELIPGTPSSPEMKAGDRIVQTQPTTDMDTLVTILGETAKDIQRITSTLTRVIGTSEGETNFRLILDNMKDLSIALNETIQSNRHDITRLVANLSDFSEKLKEIGDTDSDDVHVIVQNVREASEHLQTLTAGLNQISNRINSGRGTIGKLIQNEETVDHLNNALASLNEVTRKINDGEGTLGKLVNEEETAENLNSALTGINEFISKEKRFRTFLDYRGEYLFDSGDAKSYLSLYIQPREDKYYLLQLVDDPMGTTETTDITGVRNGIPINEHIVETDRDKLKFSAQIAKRYYDIAFRGGLFESTGGLGIDYYMLNDRLTFSLEAFDFDPDENAHLKFKADFTPFQHVYLTAGFDDFISDEGNESFFVGGGINFSDEDIKTLLLSAPLPID